MKVRPYHEGDLLELVNLWNEAHRGSHEFIPYTEENLQEELKSAHCALVAVDEDGSVLGFAILKHEWYGEEIKLYSLPELNRREIEGRLLATIEQEA